mgnify:CR=1 FL=1
MTEPTKSKFWEERSAKMAAEKAKKPVAPTPEIETGTAREPAKRSGDSTVKIRE